VTPLVQPDLSGQVAFVTGASRGIGRALATGYAAAGATVVLAARTSAQLDHVAATIVSTGGTAYTAPLDVTDRAALAVAVEDTVARFGSLDLVVVNAGVYAPGQPGDVKRDFASVLDVNVTSVHDLARLSEPHLRAKGGKLLVIGSGAGRRALPGGVAYSVSKAAVAMLVRSLAIEWRPARIAVNEIIPGPVLTDMAGDAGLDSDELPDALRLDWIKSPIDVVPLALFLAGLPNDGPTGQTFSLLGRDL
jgi:3-oxoacyl-[acyl-carrier protein] reductase